MASRYLLYDREMISPFGTAPINAMLYANYMQNNRASPVRMSADAAMHVSYDEDQNTLLLSNELTDYLERHPALAGLSAYELKAFFHKIKPHRGHMDSVSHLHFGERHPQKATHCHSPLPKYKMPQMYCRWPEEPDASADEEERNAYAAFVLGLFSAYTADDLRVGGWARATPNRSLWDIYIAWRDERATDRQLWFLTNFQKLVAARKATRRYNEICRAAGLFDTGEDDETSGDGEEAEETVHVDIDDESVQDEWDQDENTEVPSFTAQNSANGVAHLADLCSEFNSIASVRSAAPTHTFATAEETKARLKKMKERESELALNANAAPSSAAATAQRSRRPPRRNIPANAFVGATPEQLMAAAPHPQMRFDRLVRAPSIEQTRHIWTLDQDQSVIFLILAHHLMGEPLPELESPLNNLLLLGPPGTGKSRVIQALIWHAFQHNKLHLLATTAYTWKAALNISCPELPALSTSRLFEINIRGRSNSGPTALGRLQANLGNVKIVIVDEVSFIKLQHLHRMNAQAQRRSEEAIGQFFGNIFVVCAGDLNQHQPPSGSPLFKDGHAYRHNVPHIEDPGSRVWRSLTNVFQLSKAHRFTDTPAGRTLQRIARTFLDPSCTGDVRPARCPTDRQRQHLTDSNIEWLLRELNSRYPGAYEDYIRQGKEVRVIVQRNEVRQQLNLDIARIISDHKGEQVFVWRSTDHSDLPMEESSWRKLLDSPPEHTGNIPGINIFFNGILYLLSDNDAPALGRVNNNTAVGVKLILDPREPAITTEQRASPVHYLRFPPAAIIVAPSAPNPVNVRLDSGTDLGMPPGAVAIQPIKMTFMFKTHPHKPKITRTGFRLSPGYAVTDYYVQGVTLPTDEMWFTDFRVPADNRMKKETGYVAATRYRSLDNLFSLTPLFNDGVNIRKTEIFKKYKRVLTAANQDRAADLARLADEAAATKARLGPLYAEVVRRDATRPIS
jgi:hypothetical protein